MEPPGIESHEPFEAQAIPPHVEHPPQEKEPRKRSPRSERELFEHLRSIRDALRAARQGDFAVRLPMDGDTGVAAEVALEFNGFMATQQAWVEDLARIVDSVTRQGRLSERVTPRTVTGAWSLKAHAVNELIQRLAWSINEGTRVSTAIVAGNFSQPVQLQHDGELLRGDFLVFAKAANEALERLGTTSSEVTRVLREIGAEGELGAKATIPEVGGAWMELAETANLLSGNLTAQFRNIALVTTAVANGDLSQKITAEARGEIRELKDTINTMVEQLRLFASEVTRVAREVGTEGKLGGQADVRGVSGTWRDLTDSVNVMAGNLTVQLRDVSKVATAIASGDLTQKVTVSVKGEILQIKDVINTMVDQLRNFASEVTRVAREVGTEGKLGGQADVRGVSGTWKDLTDSVNVMAGNLTAQVRNIAQVATAIANGDLSQKITVDVKGEILELKNTINAMVDRLQTFAAEVTRVAREVGTEGKLGGQARVPGVAGTWMELTDSVNVMAGNLTGQVRGIAKVVTAVAQGDLSQKVVFETRGEIAALADTINAMTDTLRLFAEQVTSVAREVGLEGKLGGQAKVPGAAGTWKDLTDNVNLLAGNLTAQVRNIAQVATAIAKGDLSQKITVDVKGEILELKNTINTMVDQLRNFASEVTRVAREVGTEGRLGGQAEVQGVAGTWKDLTDSVNVMGGNLTAQVRNIAQVATAIANGDLSQKITVDVKGEILELKNTINAMVDRLQTFAAEVTRVAREVGTEGKLGGQARVPGVAGTWMELTDSVNVMAGNLTGQVRGIAKVVTAVAQGDLSQKVVFETRGEIAALADTINAMTDTLRLFAEQVTSVAREVGLEGKLGGQAKVPGAAGTWKDLTDNVNLLAGNLTAQVRNIAQVATAIAKGDLSQKITVDVKGEILELKNTINTMVDQLRNFASEVTRVAREVGTEGRLGGQARVPGVAGTWMELTDSVNMMAGNLTGQVRGIAKVVTAVAEGDLSQKLVLEARGEIATLADTINAMTDTLRLFAEQVTSVAREVGLEGKLGGQARVPGAAGTWKDLTDSVNMLAGNLTSQVRNIAKVTTAVANGDLSQKITVAAQGEVLELKDTLNAMVERLRTFAAEVTRVAREVGTEGKLGGQASVPDVAGTWKELTDNVNLMASNLTDQVRGISALVTAVANGELARKLTLVARGEIATLADTINAMTDTLRIFAEQVTSVAREVGIEGKLGGQAEVPGAAGTWRDLTDNVNRLAANLTTQVRAIADVATSVTKGDLSRTITVEARGEVQELKNTINQMIGNLANTTETNKQQDWLKSNLARFFGMMQGQRNLEALADMIVSELTPVVGAQSSAFYVAKGDGAALVLELLSTYAFTRRKRLITHFTLGEGLVGQAAKERKPIVVTSAPEGYMPVLSALGEASPRNIAVMPILFEGQVRGVIELASFSEFTPIQLNFLEQLTLNVGVVMNMIGASARTEELLQQVQKSNVEMEARKNELEEKAQQLEVKNREIAETSAKLQDKAKELAQVSTYKSQFLANMSHEIRTPLNSMLILAQMLGANPEKNLTDKQKEYADIIHSSGRDLLALINQILDLSKVEAGRIEVHPEPVYAVEVANYVERMFRPVATEKKVGFTVEISPDAAQVISVDRQLLHQVLKNLLSNAFKFTHEGEVRLRIFRAPAETRFRNPALQHAGEVLAFAVSDTGIGIPEDKRDLVFEAFQQADASTARKYGGTGLGLTIAREYARVLGAELRLESKVGAGSTFTLYLPVERPAVEPGVPERISRRRPAAVDVTAPGPAEAEADLEVRGTALKGFRLLVVDDDARNLFVTSGYLEGQGAEVLTANTAREAIEKVKAHGDINLVLMDIMLPEVDGLRATREIHALPGAAGIPVVAYTAKASAADRDEVFAAGCVDIVIKPAETRQLLAVLLKHLPPKGGPP
ncbi:MAG: HAMP domain-containing protein [Myxococcota bacterium]